MAPCHFGSHRKHSSMWPCHLSSLISMLIKLSFDINICVFHVYTLLYLYFFSSMCLVFMGKHFDIFPRLMPTAHKAFPCRPGLDITRHQRPQAPMKHAIISNGRDQSSNEESDEEAEDTSSSEAKTLGIKASLSGIISSQPYLRKTRESKHDPQG